MSERMELFYTPFHWDLPPCASCGNVSLTLLGDVDLAPPETVLIDVAHTEIAALAAVLLRLVLGRHVVLLRAAARVRSCPGLV